MYYYYYYYYHYYYLLLLLSTEQYYVRRFNKWTEAWVSDKLRLPGLSYNWWGFQACYTLQDRTGSTDKAETSFGWQEYFSQFQYTTDALPCHIHLSVWLWTMDPHSRAPKKNTSHGNELLLQDTTHLIQRSCYQRGSPVPRSSEQSDHTKTSWPL